MMRRIEILTTFDRQDPVFRAKILGIVQGLRTSHVFEPFTNDKPCRALLLRLDLTRAIAPALLAALRLKAKHTPIHLFVPDFEAKHEPALASLNGIVQVYIVATPELQSLLAFKVSGSVHHIPDPIDFGLSTKIQRSHVGPNFDEPLKLAWFGYPESYLKSMRPLEDTFEALAASGQVALNVYTSVNQLDSKPFMRVKAYRVDTILSELAQHDAVILSHLAHDFSINTYFKSENKAVLAINRGLPVIASNTPSYARLLGRFGLDDFLFSSKVELMTAVVRMRVAAERSAYLERCQEQITADYNYANIARQWVQLLE